MNKNKFIFLLFFILNFYFLFLLSGCSGCTYFYLKIEDLDKTKSQSSDSQNGTPADSDSNNNNNSNNQQTSYATQINLSITQGSFEKLSSDTEYTAAVILTLDAPAGNDFEVSIITTSTYATSSDYNLNSTTVSFLKGDIQKTLNLTIKGNVTGSQDFTKQILISALPNLIQTSIPMSNVVSFLIYDNHPLVLSVASLFPSNGTLWNSYLKSNQQVRFVSPLLKVDLTQSTAIQDLACTNSNTYCVHAGELRKVLVTNQYSCANLTLQDSADAFEWRCSDQLAPVTFYSVGFKIGRGLKDLILSSGTAFKSLQVTLYKNAISQGASNSSVWWSNPVFKYDSTNINSSGGRLSLNQNNTVYAITENVTSRGINFDANNISLVVLTSATLSPGASFNNYDCFNQAMYPGVQECFIYVNRKPYTWIEGSMVGKIGTTLISNAYIDPDSSFYYGFRLHNANLNLSGGDGVYNERTNNSTFTQSYIYGGVNGIIVDTSFNENYFDLKFKNIAQEAVKTGWANSNVLFYNVQAECTPNTNFNCFVLETQRSTYQHFKVSNSSVGVYNPGSHIVSYVDGFSNNNSNTGFYLTTISNLSNLTAINNITYGIIATEDNFSATNLLTVNNGTGLLILTGWPTYLNQIYSLDNQMTEIYISSSSKDITFSDKLVIGRTSPACTYGTGLTNVGLSGATCDAAGTSVFTKYSGVDSNALFKKFTNDSLNSSGVFGAAGIAWGSILDFFNFENNKRIWTNFDTSLLPNSNIRGACSGTLPNCGIYDYSFSPSATLFKNANGVFVANQACPSITKGSNSILIYTGLVTTKPRLKGVAEYPFDGVGDDDGFCSSDENCYFLPDAGANLDNPWTYTDTCIYDSDGSGITNVTIYGR